MSESHLEETWPTEPDLKEQPLEVQYPVDAKDETEKNRRYKVKADVNAIKRNI
jgi:hypothetical protein